MLVRYLVYYLGEEKPGHGCLCIEEEKLYASDHVQFVLFSCFSARILVTLRNPHLNKKKHFSANAIGQTRHRTNNQLDQTMTDYCRAGFCFLRRIKSKTH
jgi:hypothetical protein